jgi:hypothetical protein
VLSSRTCVRRLTRREGTREWGQLDPPTATMHACTPTRLLRRRYRPGGCPTRQPHAGGKRPIQKESAGRSRPTHVVGCPPSQQSPTHLPLEAPLQRTHSMSAGRDLSGHVKSCHRQCHSLAGEGGPRRPRTPAGKPAGQGRRSGRVAGETALWVGEAALWAGDGFHGPVREAQRASARPLFGQAMASMGQEW